MAQKLGLTTDVAVAAGIIDAHVFVPQSGYKLGKCLLLWELQLAFFRNGKKQVRVCAVLLPMVFAEFYGYEAGQACRRPFCVVY